MKSEHRHELETNWLAHHVAIWLDRLQPYNSLIVGSLLTIVILFFAYSFFGGESSARQSAAWSSYNQAVAGNLPNLETLHESAEEYPDSPMQQFADITWADGQVWMASRLFIQNRAAAMESLNRATGTYQGLLQESEDERLKGRAHFGLGRVYELRSDLDKAREEYLAVKGGFELLAQQRAKELEEQNTKEAYAWLATAEGPRRAAPAGPGTPGQRPGFAPGELDLPAAGTTTNETGATMSIDELFQGIGETGDKDDPNVVDRYDSDETKSDDTASTDAPADDSAPTDDAKPKK
ncbi:MAG: hypothetical protein WD971_00020 [Pirellulales bacterium]